MAVRAEQDLVGGPMMMGLPDPRYNPAASTISNRMGYFPGPAMARMAAETPVLAEGEAAGEAAGAMDEDELAPLVDEEEGEEVDVHS